MRARPADKKGRRRPKRSAPPVFGVVFWCRTGFGLRLIVVPGYFRLAPSRKAWPTTAPSTR